MNRGGKILLLAALAAGTAIGMPGMAAAQPVTSIADGGALHAGQLDVPVNKSQVLRIDRAYAQALVGNPEIADILPLTNRSLYVLGKKVGTTSLTIYDARKSLIAVVDVVVGPDVIGLRRQLAELMPKETIAARVSNDAVVLSGVVSSAAAADRANRIALTYAPEKVVNMLAVGASQQVMLEVRFSEMKRSAAKQIGINSAFRSDSGRVFGGTGNDAVSTTLLTDGNGRPIVDITNILDTFGIVGGNFSLGSLNITGVLDALERKGIVSTLAEPNLIALSGDTASFLAGGEFPIPVAQDSGGSGGNNGRTITIEFKPFGVSLAFTPTVLEDGIINLVVAPEVSSIDPQASINLNGLLIPGLQTRRAKTTLELRDGQSFAIAGLLRKDFQDTVRQFPVLGSIPIIGALFRSTGFQKEETELVIIVTPRLVKPMSADQVAALPTERAGEPSELELFMLGRTDKAVSTDPMAGVADPAGTARPRTNKQGGIDGETGYIVR
jgi:pilus assembly protein CpaC